MAASRQDIERWLASAKERGARYMLIVCDTFDYDDYPVCIQPGQYYDKFDEYCKAEMQRIMEVYDLNMDIEAQLAERRAWYPPDLNEESVNMECDPVEAMDYAKQLRRLTQRDVPISRLAHALIALADRVELQEVLLEANKQLGMDIDLEQP